ncbi:MAG: hypothetical protein MZV63_64475 [Marinilabiliales bacterium]|nr:hypothetical protein [Marinilabiliales bacterium]
MSPIFYFFHTGRPRPGVQGAPAASSAGLRLPQVALDEAAQSLEHRAEAVGGDVVVAQHGLRDRPGRRRVCVLDPLHQRRQARLAPAADASSRRSSSRIAALDARLDGPAPAPVSFGSAFGASMSAFRMYREALQRVLGRRGRAHHGPLQLAGLLLDTRAAPPCPSRAATRDSSDSTTNVARAPRAASARRRPSSRASP